MVSRRKHCRPKSTYCFSLYGLSQFYRSFLYRLPFLIVARKKERDYARFCLNDDEISSAMTTDLRLTAAWFNLTWLSKMTRPRCPIIPQSDDNRDWNCPTECLGHPRKKRRSRARRMLETKDRRQRISLGLRTDRRKQLSGFSWRAGRGYRFWSMEWLLGRLTKTNNVKEKSKRPDPHHFKLIPVNYRRSHNSKYTTSYWKEHKMILLSI